MKHSEDSRGEQSVAATDSDLDRCGYTHDVSRFDDVDGTEWQCPRSAYDEQAYCRFHLPADSSTDVRIDGETFLYAIQSATGGRAARREYMRFFGAQFDDLDLEHVIIDGQDNYPLDLRDVHVEGDLILTKAVVEPPLWLHGASIDGELRCERTRFAEHVSFREITCAGAVACDRATFAHNLDVDDAVFRSDASFYAIAVEFVSFVGTTVRGEFDFHQTTVRDNAHVHDMHVTGPVNFNKIDASARFWCFNNVFEDDVEMEKAVVGGPAFFDYTEFRGSVNYWNTTFEGRVRWKETVFDGEVDATDLTTESTAKCLRPVVGGDVDFSRLTATRGLWITAPTGPDGDREIVFEQATIEEGKLEKSVDGRLEYDLTEATIGDVRVNPEPSTGFQGYHFERTRFEGFDFTAYHDVLDRRNWNLLAPDGSEDLATSGVEETYLKAKNGAKIVGDATAAAEFFRKEMIHRRRNHAARTRHADESWSYRAKAAGRWFASALLDVTTGYGERPWRVIACSAGCIGLFTVVYMTVMATPPYDTSLGYLVFSIESFIALVLGGAVPVQTPLIRFIAQIEGFMGAFFIALFVFTLTRSIQR
jgi:hypothetical protein